MLWTRSCPISFICMSFWCEILDPHTLITYHSNIGIYIIVVGGLGMSTLENGGLQGLAHMASQVLSPKSLEVNPCNPICLRARESELHTRSQVISPKYDMDTYMATPFGGEAWDSGWKLGQAKNYTQLPTQVPWTIILHKTIKTPSFMKKPNHILMVSWGSKVGTLPPCWDSGPQCEPAPLRYVVERC
jgi:hypothetical protein